MNFLDFSEAFLYNKEEGETNINSSTNITNNIFNFNISFSISKKENQPKLIMPITRL